MGPPPTQSKSMSSDSERNRFTEVCYETNHLDDNLPGLSVLRRIGGLAVEQIYASRRGADAGRHPYDLAPGQRHGLRPVFQVDLRQRAERRGYEREFDRPD